MVVGVINLGTGVSRAFVWDQSLGMRCFRYGSDNQSSSAYTIFQDGVKVGGAWAVQISPAGYLEGIKAVVWLCNNLALCEAPIESAAAHGVVDMDYDGDCAVSYPMAKARGLRFQISYLRHACLKAGASGAEKAVKAFGARLGRPVV